MASFWPISHKMETTSTRPAGPMARRLTTNQEIAGSTPASVNCFFLALRIFFFVIFFLPCLVNYIYTSEHFRYIFWPFLFVAPRDYIFNVLRKSPGLARRPTSWVLAVHVCF